MWKPYETNEMSTFIGMFNLDGKLECQAYSTLPNIVKILFPVMGLTNINNPSLSSDILYLTNNNYIHRKIKSIYYEGKLHIYEDIKTIIAWQPPYIIHNDGVIYNIDTEDIYNPFGEFTKYLVLYH